MHDPIVDNVRASFQAMLSHDFDTARRHLAAAQRDEFGMNPWRYGVPVVDALGQAIVFRDRSGGSTYQVSHVQPNGAHARCYFDGTQSVQSVEVEGRAPTWEEAEKLAGLELLRHGGDEIRPLGGGRTSDGQFYFMRFRKARTPLD